MNTLALNMIVGPNEAEELERCLISIKAKDAFDEIVIVLTSNDSAVETVARRFTEKVFNHPWTSEQHPYGDFGGARNVALDNTVSDYVMWLDADDVIMAKYYEAWVRLYRAIRENDLFQMQNLYPVIALPYAVVHDLNGNPQTVFMKERIFKREPQYRWVRPVHERFMPPEEFANISRLHNVTISHMPEKPNFVSAVRNVRILQHEYESGNDDAPIRYYLGRDSMMAGDIDGGIKMLESLIDNMEGTDEDMHSICMDVLYWYAYRSSVKFKPRVDELVPENEKKIESWARMALACSQEYAEPLVILADLYCRRGLIDKAEVLYATAMQKKIQSGRLQHVGYYREIPADRLSRIYAERGSTEKALFYNRIAIDRDSGNQDYRAIRKNLVAKLVEEVDK